MVALPKEQNRSLGLSPLLGRGSPPCPSRGTLHPHTSCAFSSLPLQTGDLRVEKICPFPPPAGGRITPRLTQRIMC